MKSPEETKMTQPAPASSLEQTVATLAEQVKSLAAQNSVLIDRLNMVMGPSGSPGDLPQSGLGMGLEEIMAKSGMKHVPKAGKKVKIRLIRGAYINGKIVEPVPGKENIHEVDEDTAKELCDKTYQGPFAFRGGRFEDIKRFNQKRAERIA